LHSADATEGPAQPGDDLRKENHSSRTKVTLLGRIRQDHKDQAAWNDLVAIQEEIRKLVRIE
jgi:hypothetical protein